MVIISGRKKPKQKPNEKAMEGLYLQFVSIHFYSVVTFKF